MEELVVHEIFASLQGEGPLSGIPAVFLRLSGCVAPYCSWCDTPESFEDGEKMPVEQVLERVTEYAIPLVVVTGGEPFLQWESGLKSLHRKLLQSGFQVQYETSGKVEIPNISNPFAIEKHDHVTVVCSPKQLEGGCFDSEGWSFLTSNHDRVDYYKFVYHRNEKVIADFVEKFEVPPGCVFVMPEGDSRQKQIDRMPEVWDLCVKRGWRFSSRLHTIAFDGRKQV